ncbi:hypothetical protein B0H14DRAFT_3463837 [Mycena olivaceomarginata]|nr:hypothetical protein B0H14DRAFT_3463837 [Mycena olivaceomarginata]
MMYYLIYLHNTYGTFSLLFFVDTSLSRAHLTPKIPPKDSANWTENPEDLTIVLQFLHSQKIRAGQGGNFDKTVFSEAPKTAIADKWKACKKLHEYFLKIKQGVYVGASGWTYTDEGGFNVTDDTRDAWHNFVKAHLHFKNFATRGWAHFQVVDEIVPSRACGRYVFNAGATQADGHGLGTSLGSPDDDDTPPSDALTQSSDLSQPLTDWSQTNFHGSQTSDVPDPASSLQISTTQSTS